MSSFLDHLAARALGLPPDTRPRLSSRFEPAAPLPGALTDGDEPPRATGEESATAPALPARRARDPRKHATPAPAPLSGAAEFPTNDARMPDGRGAAPPGGLPAARLDTPFDQPLSPPRGRQHAMAALPASEPVQATANRSGAPFAGDPDLDRAPRLSEALPMTAGERPLRPRPTEQSVPPERFQPPEEGGAIVAGYGPTTAESPRAQPTPQGATVTGVASSGRPFGGAESAGAHGEADGGSSSVSGVRDGADLIPARRPSADLGGEQDRSGATRGAQLGAEDLPPSSLSGTLETRRRAPRRPSVSRAAPPSATAEPAPLSAGDGAPPPSAPAVQITIGRIEVRAVAPPPAPARSRSAPPLGLDAYLRRRASGGD